MIQKYHLDGLNCAHCAGLIESEIQKWPDIQSGSLNMMSNILTVDTAIDEMTMLERITNCVNRIESGVTVRLAQQRHHDHDHDHHHDHDQDHGEGERGEWVRFGIGLVLFLTGMLAPVSERMEMGAFLLAYLIVGLPILSGALKTAIGGFIFNEEMLMAVASLGAMAVGEFAEGVAVMLFYTLGELLQGLAVARSKRSIASLLDLRPDFVRIQTADGWQEVNPEEVAIGTLIQVKPGERIALDGEVVEGSASLDTSAVTGESRPFDVGAGDKVQSGSVNSDGVLVIRVTKAYGDSTLARILSLVEDASARKAPTEKFISRFARYYTPLVVGLAALVAIAPPLLFHGEWQTWIYRGLVFLVVSCPCALVISVPLTYFAGIGGASRQHILVKGGQYLEALAGVRQVAFDKTGTLTQGEFVLTEVRSVAPIGKNALLQIAAALEEHAAHPLAQAIVKANQGNGRLTVKNFRNLAGEGVTAEVQGKIYFIGNRRLLDHHQISYDAALIPNGTTVLLADTEKLLGIFLLEDFAKEGAKEAVQALHSVGVETTAVLSGDTPEVAKDMGKRLGITEVYGGLLPEDKITVVEKLMTRQQGKLAFIGDGINDAPVLARADVGIAMGGVGSDAAIEAADVVLMSDHPRDVVKAIKLAKRTRLIALENIVGALGFKAILLLLATLGLANMWMAVFADVGVAIIAVINSLRAMALIK